MLPLYAVQTQIEWEPRYNIAPTQSVLAIRRQSQTLSRELVLLRWGLIPSWAKDEKIGHSLINARAETVAEKPSFRSAFKKSRCLIVADGFYEWRNVDGKKQPYFIHLKNDQPFAFAGLAERWKSDGKTIESCAIVTTEPNSLMAELHNRMPAIISPTDYDCWLDPEFQSREELLAMLRPYAAEEMAAHPVSTWVNNPRHESAQCLAPLES